MQHDLIDFNDLKRFENMVFRIAEAEPIGAGWKTGQVERLGKRAGRRFALKQDLPVRIGQLPAQGGRLRAGLNLQLTSGRVWIDLHREFGQFINAIDEHQAWLMETLGQGEAVAKEGFSDGLSHGVFELESTRINAVAITGNHRGCGRLAAKPIGTEQAEEEQ